MILRCTRRVESRGSDEGDEPHRPTENEETLSRIRSKRNPERRGFVELIGPKDKVLMGVRNGERLVVDKME